MIVKGLGIVVVLPRDLQVAIAKITAKLTKVEMRVTEDAVALRIKFAAGGVDNMITSNSAGMDDKLGNPAGAVVIETNDPKSVAMLIADGLTGLGFRTKIVTDAEVSVPDGWVAFVVVEGTGFMFVCRLDSETAKQHPEVLEKLPKPVPMENIEA
ncbi:MAG: hypothetical protein NT041_01315 [Candidatus Vogelbacteria bacterium]|nr:hypothetical protein [Candidatus Vogelbacteria bacterium]